MACTNWQDKLSEFPATQHTSPDAGGEGECTQAQIQEGRGGGGTYTSPAAFCPDHRLQVASQHSRGYVLGLMKNANYSSCYCHHVVNSFHSSGIF